MTLKEHFSEWKRLEKFHKKMVEEAQQSKLQIEAFKAFLELSEIAKKLELSVPKHPIYSVLFKSNVYYPWLIKFNKMIRLLLEIPGSEPRIKKFFNSRDSYDSESALYELEVALRLYLHGIITKFQTETSAKQTPDIEIMIGNESYDVEVTTLNIPGYVTDSHDFVTRIIGLMMQNKVEIAGKILHVPQKKHLEFLKKIEDGIVMAKKNEKVVILQEKRAFVLQIAPDKDYSLEKSGFEVNYRTLVDIEDKILRKIDKKYKQISANKRIGILCLYAGSRNINAEDIFDKVSDKINSELETYENIAGLVISSYSSFLYEKENVETKKKKSKILVKLIPGIGKFECSTIWENKFSKEKLPKEFIEAYKKYEQNMEKKEKTS